MIASLKLDISVNVSLLQLSTVTSTCFILEIIQHIYLSRNEVLYGTKAETEHSHMTDSMNIFSMIYKLIPNSMTGCESNRKKYLKRFISCDTMQYNRLPKTDMSQEPAASIFRVKQ
jgi:hypothetical protein